MENQFPNAMNMAAKTLVSDPTLRIIYMNLPKGHPACFMPPPQNMIVLPRIDPTLVTRKQQVKMTANLYHELRHHALSSKEALDKSIEGGALVKDLANCIEDARIELSELYVLRGGKQDLTEDNIDICAEKMLEADKQLQNRWGWLSLAIFFHLTPYGTIPVADEIKEYFDIARTILSDGRFQESVKMGREGNMVATNLAFDIVKAWQEKRKEETKEQEEETNDQAPSQSGGSGQGGDKQEKDSDKTPGQKGDKKEESKTPGQKGDKEEESKTPGQKGDKEEESETPGQKGDKENSKKKEGEKDEPERQDGADDGADQNGGRDNADDQDGGDSTDTKGERDSDGSGHNGKRSDGRPGDDDEGDNGDKRGEHGDVDNSDGNTSDIDCDAQGDAVHENPEQDAKPDGDADSDGDRGIGGDPADDATKLAPGQRPIDITKEYEKDNQNLTAPRTQNIRAFQVAELGEEGNLDQFLELLKNPNFRVKLKNVYVPYSVNDREVVAQKFPEDFSIIESQIKQKIVSLQNHLSLMLRILTQAQTSRFQKHGQLDPMAYYKIPKGSRYVKSITSPAMHLDSAVSLMIDLSGSMSGKKAELAVQIATLFGEALCNIPKIVYEVRGYNTSPLGDYQEKKIANDGYSRTEIINHWVFKRFSENWREVRTRLGACRENHQLYDPEPQRGGAVGGCNVDHENINLAAHHLYARPEKNKIMIILCDGQPSGYHHTYGGIILQELKKTIAKIRKSGIKLFCFGIMTEDVTEYYSPDVEIIYNLNDLNEKSLQKLAELILQGGKK